MVAVLPEDRDHVGALAHAGPEVDRRPDVGPELEVLHGVAERVLPERRLRLAESLGHDLADAPADDAEVVGA